MPRKWVILVACLGILLVAGGLAYRARQSPQIAGIGGIQPLEAVLPRVRQTSPLQVVTATDVTRFLPTRHVIFGRDRQGRELVVWARVDTERFEYLDRLNIKSRDAALTAAAAAGIDVHNVQFAVLSYFDSGSQPIVWQIGIGTKEVFLDAATGTVIK